MKEVCWGIIGCGDVTEVKSGPGFQKAEGSKLVAVMRRNGELARDYAQRHGVPKWYDKAEDLIHDPEVNAIYIATPPAFHKPYTLEVARAGKPVYVEKPMALSTAECSDMIDACQRFNVPLFVAYYRRAQPRFLKVKELIDSGAIGDVRAVNVVHWQPPHPDELQGVASWRVKPEISGGGHFFDVASHSLDLLDYLLQPILECTGQASNQAGLYQAEDIVTASFLFEGGVHGTGSWCYTAGSRDERVEIAGSKGKLVFSVFANRPIELISSAGTQQWDIASPEHVAQPLIQTIVDELLGKGSCPSTGESAARTNAVMDRLVRQFYH